MYQTTYFARISYQTRPSNKLQQAILLQIEKYDNILTQEPEELFTLIDGYTQQANRTHHRCGPMRAHSRRSHPEKELTSIEINGLVSISFHKVIGTFPKVKAEPAPAAPAPPVAVTPPPPPPVVAETAKPRQSIMSGREGGKEERLEFWDRFSGRVQTLLTAGRIWSIYRDSTNQVVAEEYGGTIHPAF